MAKLFSTFPVSIDTTLSSDRQSGDIVTSDSYDIIETALSALENKVGIDTSGVVTSLDYKIRFHSQPTCSINLCAIGTPPVSALKDYFDHTGSSGYSSGGTLVTGGVAGTVNLSAGTGFIRALNNNTDNLLSFNWAASAGIAIPSNTARYIYMDYNGGTPAAILSASEFAETPDRLLLGVAVNEGGNIRSVFNLGVRLEESIGQAGRFLRRVSGISRDVRRGGLIIGQTGTRNVTLSMGSIWWGRTEYTIAAKDTSVSDTFTTYSRNGSGGWTITQGQTQWPNTQYDNGSGTLATLGANKWGVLWFYVSPDDHILMLYGTAEHNTAADSELQSPPSLSPDHVSQASILVGRFIFQKSASTATVETAFTTNFTLASVTDHGNSLSLRED